MDMSAVVSPVYKNSIDRTLDININIASLKFLYLKNTTINYSTIDLETLTIYTSFASIIYDTIER